MAHRRRSNIPRSRATVLHLHSKVTVSNSTATMDSRLLRRNNMATMDPHLSNSMETMAHRLRNNSNSSNKDVR